MNSFALLPPPVVVVVVFKSALTIVRGTIICVLSLVVYQNNNEL